MENKLEAVVVAIGTDIKNLRKAINDKETSTGITEQQLNEAIQRVKSDILGEGVPENLDTLKEIADKIATLGGDTSGAIVAKLTELGQKIDDVTDVDYLAAYNEAKGEQYVNLIEALKQIGRDIKALVIKIDKNEKALEGLQPTVEALATNLDQILGEVVSREEFDELKKEIETLKGKQNHE